MRINAFLFDWSGVVSDDRWPVYEANMRVFEDYGKPRLSFWDWLPQTTMTPLGIFKNHGIDEDPKKLFALYARYYTKIVKSGMAPTAYPDARDVFQYIKDKGKKLAVLSSHPEGNLRREAEQYSILPLLDHISGNSKDKAQGLISLCSHLGEAPEHALYTGDMIYDIRGAKEAGLNSAGVCTGYHTKERLEKEKPDLMLECLSDLKNMKIF
jgi:phosphoglycolate phosphatase